MKRGENGCLSLVIMVSGKSTTVRLIDGFAEAKSGEIWIDGDCLTPENVWEKDVRLVWYFKSPDNQFVGGNR